MTYTTLSYTERAAIAPTPLAKRLLTLLDAKKTNLAVSADVTCAAELITLAEQLGPEICILKTHIDMLTDFTPALIDELVKLANQHRFLLFEDRKFADIGNTVKQQYGGGIYHIADWADITNAHCLPGPGIIEGLADVGLKKQRGLLLLAEMSSAGHLMDKNYMAQTLNMATAFPDFVIGFITQHALTTDPRWLNLTPGIQLTAGRDSLGQQYITPDIAIGQNGTDIIIVGRGITKTENCLTTTQLYRQRAWDAYETRRQH